MNDDVLWKLVGVWEVLGVFGVGADEVLVPVMEGDSVTLNTDVKTNQQETIKWYLNDFQIVQINGHQSEICTNVQCAQRLKDRLKQDHQTGSLTIMNIRSTDSGLYILEIINSGSHSEHIFNVNVYEVSPVKQDKMKRKSVMEGESVTLNTGAINIPNDLLMWYFNKCPFAEITGDQSTIFKDEQCEERFRDRLKLNQNGSLTIINTRTTDSGLYHLQITSSSFSISRTPIVLTVIAFSLSTATVAGICAAVVLVPVAAATVTVTIANT
ncbi:uncharacterized protein LOC127158673 [Labeo rohita]|uniref:uncharacterized protein LOC127158673 n=1 Tax=Labeo rohita TaxID=84645 RepID=UPI0021E20192|nr:uncharacterized protein LOC127158673 [Labeo rohita]